MPGNHSPGRPLRAHRGRLAALIALILLCGMAATPEIRQLLHLTPPRPPASVNGVRLLPPPRSLQPVALSAVATPIDPSAPPATAAAVDPAREAAAVSLENTRLRILLHDSVRAFLPEVISVRGALPTLILSAGVQSHYTISDLIKYGALLVRPHGAALQIDSVFVSSNASLTIASGPQFRALYLDSTPSGFATIVSWGGQLTFRGTAARPLTIMGWDHQLGSPATDRGDGRSYIRAVGGKMTLTDVRAAWLGFWSGRTGGVAWTGITTQRSTGSATGSTFTDDTYGAFVSRAQDVRFSEDLFEFNQLDGLHVHRYSVGVSVTDSSAARNGGNGFVVARAAQGTTLRSDVAEHNAGDGFRIDGRPLTAGASPSGGAVTPGSGTRISHSAAIGNLKIGILLEGGSGTSLISDEVCAHVTGVAIRFGATGTVVTGSDVRCAPRTAFEVGPNASGTVIAGNTIVGARIGMLVRNAAWLQADHNVISGVAVFGITVRGAVSRVSGEDNVISGTGFRAVDARADAPRPALLGTDTSGWLHHVKITPLNYLAFHPLAASWLGILLLIVIGPLWSRRKRVPAHPYAASTTWQPGQADRPAEREAAQAAAAPADVGASAGSKATGTEAESERRPTAAERMALATGAHPRLRGVFEPLHRGTQLEDPVAPTTGQPGDAPEPSWITLEAVTAPSPEAAEPGRTHPARPAQRPVAPGMPGQPFAASSTPAQRSPESAGRALPAQLPVAEPASSGAGRPESTPRTAVAPGFSDLFTPAPDRPSPPKPPAAPDPASAEHEMDLAHQVIATRPLPRIE